MKRKLLFVLSIFTCSLISGCVVPTGAGVYNPRLYKSGCKTKGVVAMLPVILSTQNRGGDTLPWSLREEFTEELGKKLSSSDKIFLIKHNAPASVVTEFFSPMPKTLSPEVTNQFLPAEFVVAAELIHHSSVSDSLKSEAVSASVRVRVYDIRHASSKLVYQEIIDARQPLTQSVADYSRIGWKSSLFESTPMGLMHSRLIREISARVEGYICANYS